MPNNMKKAGIKYKDGGQALFDALKKKGYKKDGGSLLNKMSGGPMMDMSQPMVMKMRGHGGGMQSMPAKMPKAGKGKYIGY
jgi:hypothetical protein